MAASSQPTIIALLAVMKLKGFGRRAALKIVGEPARETESGAYREFFLSRTSQLYNKRLPESRLIRDFMDAWAKSEEQLAKSGDSDIQAVSIYDDGYPERLKRIPDPPAVLFIKGNAKALESAKSLAVVGTREPTSYGAESARRCAITAVDEGFVIVSGLAHGCDVSAHEGCLEAKGTGVAVLAHGLDQVYPAPSRGLAARLLEHDGCLISEYPVSVKPSRLTFAERDRLQSGLSDAVLVIETDIEGGTKHTIRYALAQNKPLACIHHPPRLLSEPKSRGNQKLIGDGSATSVTDKTSLIEFLGSLETAVLYGDKHQPRSEDMVAERQIGMGL